MVVGRAQCLCLDEPENLFIQAQLRLASQAVVQAREEDYELVAGVNRRIAQRRIVRRLARLDIAHDETTPIERAVEDRRIFQQTQDLVRGLVDTVYDCRWKLTDVQQIPSIAI